MLPTQSLLSPVKRAELLSKLSEPFEPEAIKWVVKDRSHDGRHGKIFPYADSRAYTDRLNDVVSPSGWDDAYSVETLASAPIARTSALSLGRTTRRTSQSSSPVQYGGMGGRFPGGLVGTLLIRCDHRAYRREGSSCGDTIVVGTQQSVSLDY